MVYIPRLSFKTGVNPSLANWFPKDTNFSGTQKLMLTRTRIFGDKISGNLRSGMKPWRKVKGARFGWFEHETLQLYNINRYFPFFRDEQKDFVYKVMKERQHQNRLKKEAKKEAKKKK